MNSMTQAVDLAERNRFLAWMKDRGMSFDALQEITGENYTSIFLMLRARPEKARPINEKFKWRFAQQFGLEEARKIFEDAPPVSIAELA